MQVAKKYILLLNSGRLDNNMLIDVKTRFCAETGYIIGQQDAAINRVLQSAAKDIYNMLECNKIYREVTLAVAPDAVVSLPSFIGELRGMRMHTNELPFDLESIGQPRYITNTLEYKYRNWRDLAEKAIHSLPTLVGKLTLTTANIENPPAEIVILGQTNKANRVEEVVTLDGSPKNTVNLFGPTIDSIASLSTRTSDITISDANGNELAILYNNFPKTRYKIVDVSQVFWTLDTVDGQSLIDVLYKIPLPTLSNDTDSFPAGEDYDNAWFHQAMYLHLKPLDGRLQDALTERQSAIDAIKAAKDGSENGIAKKMQFGRNKFFGLFRKYRYFPGSVTNVDHNIQS